MIIIMTEIAKKKFEILDYTLSDNFTIAGLADKLNELTDLSQNNIVKPPLGLKPKKLHDEQRYVECKEAIERYVNAGCKVPQEWLDEYNSYL